MKCLDNAKTEDKKKIFINLICIFKHTIGSCIFSFPESENKAFG